jgi:NTE family protein
MGAMNTSGSELMSYLLFQANFTRELIALGYRDAMDRSGEILRFFGGEHIQSTGATQTMRKLQSEDV